MRSRLMDRRRLRFLLALFLYVGWVFGLGAMAWLSGDRPQPRSSPRAGR
jgi:hypothetical protein